MTNNKERKNIYVVLASTPYRTGRVIRAFKRVKYNHAALSLEPTLHPMYSFSRKYEHSTFYAGFVEESLMRYQCKEGDAEILVARLPISESPMRAAGVALAMVTASTVGIPMDTRLRRSRSR